MSETRSGQQGETGSRQGEVELAGHAPGGPGSERAGSGHGSSPVPAPHPPAAAAPGTLAPTDEARDQAPLDAPALRQSSGVPPSWFRTVVWDSLLGASCQLLPLPFVDDLALGAVRRRMVARMLERWGVPLASHQLGWIAGGGRPWTVGRVASKVFLYPVKKLFKKVLYFLAVKEALDTFSLLFHQGYLLHSALARGALAGGAPVSDERAWALSVAVHRTLEEADTRPLGRLVGGVLRNSRRLLRATLAWLTTHLARGPVREELEQLASEGVDPARLAARSPEAEQLLDRLLLVLWGEEGYRHRLERILDRHLEPP